MNKTWNRFTLILLLSLATTTIFGQYPVNLKVGSYSSLNNLLYNKPQHEYKFNILKRSEFDIKMVAGNDYKIDADPLRIKSSVANDFFAVFDGDELYVNGKYINGSKHYCLVENNSRFLILKAGIPKMSKRKELGYKSSQAEYVPFGGAIGGAMRGAQLAMTRLYYIIDCENADIKILSKEILKEHPEIKKELVNIKLSKLDDPVTKLVFYRRGKKELDQPLRISVNDTIDFELIPNSIITFDVKLSLEPVRACYGTNLKECIEILLISDDLKYDSVKYVEASISNKTNTSNLVEVNTEEGEFYSKQVKYHQENRESMDYK